MYTGALRAVLLLAACSGERGTGSGGEPSEDAAADGAVEGVPPSLVPPDLAWDFYPHGLTREAIRSRLVQARPRSGHIGADETWSGAIHLTGDLQVDRGATLAVRPGTWLLVAARSDDQSSGELERIDQFNPKDPPNPGAERTELRGGRPPTLI